MAKYIAIGASVAVAVLLGGTYALTKVPSSAVCAGTSVGGGAIGGPFELVTTAGQTVTDVDVITEPTLVYFGYTFCPDVCPIDNARNASAVDILQDAGLSVTPVFITIDPARDTP